jgi:protein-disulfide isomerase
MALKASEAAECASKQGRFWEMHERLFANSATLSPDGFVRHAESIGLDGDAFSECLEHRQTLEKIRDDQAEGRRLGVTGTPAFFLGMVRADGGIDLVRRIRGSVPSEVFTTHVAKLGL